MAEISNSSIGNSSSGRMLSLLSSDPARDWAMLAAHNLTLHDLLTSSGLDSDGRWFDPATELCLVLAFSLATLLGLAANMLVALMLCRRGKPALLRTPRHWYLLNLVVSDVLMCVLCVPFTVVRLTQKDWRLGELLCRVVPFLQLTYVFVSIFTILAIAIERYRAIVCSTSVRYGSMAGPRGSMGGGELNAGVAVRLVLPAVWLLAMTLATPLAAAHRLEHVHNETGQVVLSLCVEHWKTEELLTVYTVVVLLFQFALPAAAIMALHLLICRFLRGRVQLPRVGPAESKRRQQKLARHRKNLALLTVISVAFTVQWLPITVVNIIADVDHTVFPSASSFCLIYALCLLLALSSVVINPVVYGCCNSNLRRDLCSLCSKKHASADMSRGSVRRGSSEPATILGSSAACSRHRASLPTDSHSSSSPPSSRLGRKHKSVDHTGANESLLQGLLVRRASAYCGGPGVVAGSSPRRGNAPRAPRLSLPLELK